MKNQERTRLSKVYGHLYERWNFPEDTGRCFYCDEAPYGRDHCPPLHYAELLSRHKRREDYPFYTVVCCVDCNTMLGAKPFFTLFERALYVEKKLLDQFEKEYAMWTPQEISKMGRHFQVSLKARQAKQTILLDRIHAIQLRCISAAFPGV